MSHKQWLLTGLAAVALSSGSLVLGTAPVQAQTDVTVRIIHGIGIDDAGQEAGKRPAAINGLTTAVDVYVDNELAIADFQYAEDLPLGPLPSGLHNVKLCSAITNPPQTLVGSCGEGSVGSNLGTDVTITANSTVVVAWAPAGNEQGRPTVLVFAHHVQACLPNGATRAQVDHAAAFAGPIDAAITGFAGLTAIAPGEAASVDAASAQVGATVAVSNGGGPLVSQPGADFPAGMLVQKILVGNPQQNSPYDVLTHTEPLQVPCPTTTTTAAPTTTTTTAPPVVNPTFTG